MRKTIRYTGLLSILTAGLLFSALPAQAAGHHGGYFSLSFGPGHTGVYVGAPVHYSRPYHSNYVPHRGGYYGSYGPHGRARGPVHYANNRHYSHGARHGGYRGGHGALRYSGNHGGGNRGHR